MTDDTSNKIIVAFAGRKASGKGVAGKYLAEKYAAYPIDCSDTLHEVLAIMGISETQDNIARLSMFLRSRFGADVIQRAVVIKISKMDDKLISLMGVRRLSDFDLIKKQYRFALVYVDSEYANRYQRYASRTKAGDHGSSETEFKLKDEEEPELQIESLKEIADFIVQNNGTLDEFHSSLDEVFKQLL